MKNVLWFLFGVVGGFVLAHLMNKDPRGHELLAEVDARIREFTDRIGDAYREQEARFAGLVDDVQDAAADAVGSARAAASDVAEKVADAVGDAADQARRLTRPPSLRRPRRPAPVAGYPEHARIRTHTQGPE